jgi:hypothetical protein
MQEKSLEVDMAEVGMLSRDDHEIGTLLPLGRGKPAGQQAD